MTTPQLSSLEQELHPPLSSHEAAVESDRCYFCYDAPCVTACPTGIDVPLFIRQIKTDNPGGAAKTIFNENILGGMCARVCPTETLCEQACVRNTQEDKPVRIGELQRYATDSLMDRGEQPFARAASTGKTVAVVGAGPAGLACAHRLSLHGHEVTVYEAKAKPGGLNEFGIAAYKTPENFAQREVNYILSLGGIRVEYDSALGGGIHLDDLTERHDAVFVGAGLGATNSLDIDGIDAPGVGDAVEFIAQLRQNPDAVKVGSHVVVIGGGMTAIDAAVQAKVLGATTVSLIYRRDQRDMNASEFEQQLAQTHNVQIITNLQPVKISPEARSVLRVEFEQRGTGVKHEFSCDQLLLAIGQKFHLNDALSALSLENGRIVVDAAGRTSHAQVWAGGDCASGGDDLTVSAVQAGKVAAESINQVLGA